METLIDQVALSNKFDPVSSDPFSELMNTNDTLSPRPSTLWKIIARKVYHTGIMMHMINAMHAAVGLRQVLSLHDAPLI